VSELDMSDMNASTQPKPLKPAVFHILLALVDNESHGYAIMQAVREQSGGRVPLQTGSFYRHLTKLIDQGLVAEAPAPRQVEDARRGTHYRLTARGRQALERERTYLADVMATLGGLRPASRKGSL
jgi:DNA-binding PadR family transcriptional regulator